MTLKLLAAALVLTMSTSAMARNNRAHGRILPGWGYELSGKDLAIWNYVAYRYYHPHCRCLACR
jgi:hypothetical protein